MQPACRYLMMSEDLHQLAALNDADALGGALGDAAHRGEADRMVAAENDRQRPGREYVADRARDLVEGLFQIGRDGEHVAGVAQGHLLHAFFFPVASARFLLADQVDVGASGWNGLPAGDAITSAGGRFGPSESSA